MASLNPALLQMTIGYDDLIALATLQADGAAPETAPAALLEAGVVTADGVHPVAAALTEVAVAPARSVVLERFDGTDLAPMFIGWMPDGRATTSVADERGDVVVQASELSLLRDVVRQWLLVLDRPLPEGRRPVATDTAVIDAAFAGQGANGTDATLQAVLDAWRLAWRASGSWAGRGTDAGVTVVDAGPQGWWRVDHAERRAEEVVEVVLVPLTMAEVVTVLSEVVTGRRPADGDAP